MVDDADILARLDASAPRRLLGTGILGALGLLLLWLGAAGPEGGVWRLVFALCGALFGAVALALWQATRHGIVLTETGILDTSGRVLAPMEDIAAVDRGMFAMKPSNGFVLRLNRPTERGWAPGMWWRFGRRLGIGGVTRAAEGRAMADILAIRLASRG